MFLSYLGSILQMMMKLIKMAVTQDISWVVDTKKQYNCHNTNYKKNFSELQLFYSCLRSFIY